MHAGQSVPHVHIHVLPRRPGDFEKNDDVYDAIDDASRDAARCAVPMARCSYRANRYAQLAINSPRIFLCMTAAQHMYNVHARWSVFMRHEGLAFCSAQGEKLDLDAERRVRTHEEMAAEAAELKAAFEQQHAAL